MADEARDVSGHEQLSIVLRFADSGIKQNRDQSQKSFHVNEYFLRFIKLNDFDAETLTKEIIKYLLFLNIDLKNCIALCFDG